jgi:hypothetical protein
MPHCRRRPPPTHRVLHDRQQPHERRLRVRLEHLGRARRDDADAVRRALPQVGVRRSAAVEQHGQHLCFEGGGRGGGGVGRRRQEEAARGRWHGWERRAAGGPCPRPSPALAVPPHLRCVLGAARGGALPAAGPPSPPAPASPCLGRLTCGAYLARPAGECSSRSSTTHSAMRRSSSVRDCGGWGAGAGAGVRRGGVGRGGGARPRRRRGRGGPGGGASNGRLALGRRRAARKPAPPGPAHAAAWTRLVQHGRDVGHEGLDVGQHGVAEALEEGADAGGDLWGGEGAWVRGCVGGRAVVQGARLRAGRAPAKLCPERRLPQPPPPGPPAPPPPRSLPAAPPPPPRQSPPGVCVWRMRRRSGSRIERLLKRTESRSRAGPQGPWWGATAGLGGPQGPWGPHLLQPLGARLAPPLGLLQHVAQAVEGRLHLRLAQQRGVHQVDDLADGLEHAGGWGWGGRGRGFEARGGRRGHMSELPAACAPAPLRRRPQASKANPRPPPPPPAPPPGRGPPHVAWMSLSGSFLSAPTSGSHVNANSCATNSLLAPGMPAPAARSAERSSCGTDCGAAGLRAAERGEAR